MRNREVRGRWKTRQSILDNAEYPPGYLEAGEKYLGDSSYYEPEPDSVLDIWEYLETWHKQVKLPSHGSAGHQDMLKIGAELIEEFKARLATAAFDSERVFFENLLKAIDYGERKPEPE